MAEFKQLAINPAAPYARDTGQSINALIRAKTPPGGSTGQVLVKVSDDSWDMEWGAGSGSGASYTNEDARDAIGAALVAGSGISIAVDDALDTITISNTGTIAVRDEGSTVAATATSLDFVGAGVTASAIGSNVTVAISSAPVTFGTGDPSTPGLFDGALYFDDALGVVYLGWVWRTSTSAWHPFAGSADSSVAAARQRATYWFFMLGN